MRILLRLIKKLPIRARVVLFGIPALAFLGVLHFAHSLSRVWDWRAPTMQESFSEWLVIAKGLLESFVSGKEVDW